MNRIKIRKTIISLLVISTILPLARVYGTVADTSIKGWLKGRDGWNYYDYNTDDMVIGWLKDNNKWYYTNENGVMQTGWIKDNNNWYYMNSNGEMQTGWIKDNNNWYYLYDNGLMAQNTTISGYQLDSNGSWIQPQQSTQAPTQTQVTQPSTGGDLLDQVWANPESSYFDAEGQQSVSDNN